MSGKEEAPRARWPNYWLLVEHETSSVDVLAIDLDSGGKGPRRLQLRGGSRVVPPPRAFGNGLAGQGNDDRGAYLRALRLLRRREQSGVGSSAEGHLRGDKRPRELEAW